MNSEYEMSLNDYLAVIKRRALLLGLSFAVILGVSLVVAVTIPPVFQSTGTILVESQQISADLVAASNTAYADERIEIIRQRVMTREHLLRIIDKYKLFSSDGKSLTVSEKIDEMRTSIRVSLVNAEVKGRGLATIAFRVSFEHQRPDIANKVANELVTLFLDENIKQRTERASETTEFLTREADKLRVELERLENQLAAFKQDNGNALPEHQELRMNMLSRTEAELKEVDRDYKTAQEELRFLDLELSAANAGLTAKTGSAYPTANASPNLASLKAEYTQLLSLYKEAHPDVRALKRQIDALEASGSDGESALSQSDLEVARVQAKIAAANARVVSLAAQRQALLAKIEGYERQILQTPQIERGLVTLMRDHENARKKYEEIRTKQMGAQISENLEQENKAERFVLLEPPLMPERPVKPNRKKIAALGFFLALAGSGGMVVFLETLNQRVRGADALTSVLGKRILVSIPYIFTQAELKRRRRWLAIMIVSAILVVVTSLVLLHLLYMPLDLLVFKALARFE
ncbi:polysaccharide chain length determinant protein, PEP-CTERM locus subfamily [Pseudomonas cuatrocienegasensis]|uniref:Polysaccharide chain length determinant protein, PEP-CTERM locus subfamily n=1 Tax=Pseudomonas cuatrocienegasensis TaxID=543360 RepID=A0ABY1BJ83_9PSED|nr:MULTISPECIES: Wzz/FepE/Etk N-terminal domain-containing protein [Pseudomonas]OEC35133.1 lipopolysaccharide biosynthesis protein [Pseudomonas sp. 21C1]SEQ99631.1 polysaccharide chain length determinant protein, PEP-CTERM locus subfamily [Pseudomonas cuatrocienegasensis]